MNTQDTVHRKSAAELRIRRVMDALEKNNMQAYYAPTCADAVKIAKELLQPGDVISCGGSVTLDETGVMDLMRCGDYEFLDRTTAKTPEEREKLYREVFSSDVFLTGTNAVTEHGDAVRPEKGAGFCGVQQDCARYRRRRKTREKLCDARKCHAAEFGHAVHARSVSRHGRRAVRGLLLGKSHLRDVHGFGTPAREGQNSCHSHR